MVLQKDGSVWTTGRNSYGQLGDGTTSNMRHFKKVIKSGVRGMTAGLYHSMVLQNTGYIMAVGWNKYGQFGDGSKTSSEDFVKVGDTGDNIYISRNLMSPREPITTTPSISGVFPCSAPVCIVFFCSIVFLSCACLSLFLPTLCTALVCRHPSFDVWVV